MQSKKRYKDSKRNEAAFVDSKIIQKDRKTLPIQLGQVDHNFMVRYNKHKETEKKMRQTQQYTVGKPGKWVTNMLQQLRTRKSIKLAVDQPMPASSLLSD